MRFNNEEAATIAKTVLERVIDEPAREAIAGNRYRLAQFFDVHRRVWRFELWTISEAERLRRLALEKMKEGRREEALRIRTQCNEEYGPARIGEAGHDVATPLAIIEVEDDTGTGRVVAIDGKADKA